jgi:hypothetical protein
VNFCDVRVDQGFYLPWLEFAASATTVIDWKKTIRLKTC